MMEYFRKFLIFLRRKDNTEMTPAFIVRLGITGVLSIAIGVVMDSFLPFNFVLNGLRGFVANLTGFSLYSLAYLISIRYSKNKLKDDRYYLTVRKRFSYRQRMNISIVLGTISGLFVFLTTRENFAFTLTSSFLIFTALVLIAFSRRNRDEFLKDIYEIPDVRDLEFMSKKNDGQDKDEEK